jgi:hypothetical protein
MSILDFMRYSARKAFVQSANLRGIHKPKSAVTFRGNTTFRYWQAKHILCSKKYRIKGKVFDRFWEEHSVDGCVTARKMTAEFEELKWD